MDSEAIVTIGRNALFLTLELSAPTLLAALFIGLLVSVFQAATQIQESTLTFAPKLIGVCVVLALTGLWMIARLSQFTTSLLNAIPLVGR